MTDIARRLTRLEVTAFHLGLLERLSTYTQDQDSDFPTLAVDTKRPYGNSDILKDLAEVYMDTLAPKSAELLTLEADDYGRFLLLVNDRVQMRGEQFDEFLLKTHREMICVLQILISNQGIEEATYIRKPSTTQWEADI